MANLKRNSGKHTKKDVIRSRSKYVDNSIQFVGWVNSLGFEKSVIGRWAQKVDQRFSLRQLAILFLCCLLLSFLLFVDFNVPYEAIEGTDTKVDLKSPISFTIVDEVATEEKRLEAERGVLSLFDFDPDAYDKLDARVYKSFKSLSR